MSRCRETAGILFKHRCSEPVFGPCQSCGKPVCRKHSRPSGYGVVCVSCMRSQVQQTDRRENLLYLRDDPYFFWYFHNSAIDEEVYGVSDFGLFDAGEHDFGSDVTDNWGGS